jgi:photosystem II stability/assembly factor-like uncharacterized protein
MRDLRSVGSSLTRAAVVGLLCFTAVPLHAQDAARVGQAVEKLAWRSIGPTNEAGRVSVITGVPGDFRTFYVSGANGGVWKTSNAGVTFDPVFDEQDYLSIGAIAVAPSNPNVVYVGTGEGNPRNNASFGNGVYRSVDAGAHWTHVGLAGSDKVARIAIDDRNPDVVYVCALGREWGPNTERGVFKSTDGGRSWKRVLYRNDLTGCSDIRVHPTNSNIVYAGMYTYLRRAWHLESGGGETAVYKSVNGGQTWRKLTRGLPTEPMDRIGLAVSYSDPDVVYVVSETKTQGELWRSDDAGESFTTVSRDPNINFRPFYYADIRVDPADPNRVYALSGALMLSEDGGRTFTRIANGVHGDHQALWIDPTDPRRVLSGSDGGFQVSYDRAKTFDVINNVPFTQFYHLTYDLQTPYRICGGLQDNYHWCGPSNSLTQPGIRKRDWLSLGGGDGFFAVPVLTKPWLIYYASQGGMIQTVDTRTGMQRSVHPDPTIIGSAGDQIATHKYRFNWNSPIVTDPFDSATVYFGGNVVFRTTTDGQRWDVISPDLTKNDKAKQQSSGGPIVVDNTAAEFHNALLTIAPSRLTKGLIWVGADDGNVQLTRDGGATWTNVTANLAAAGLGADAWIATIDASPSDAATAYVAASRHQDDDYAPHFFMTTDFGRSWRRISGNLPTGWAHVVREDPRNKNLLWAGTEVGLFASWDRGARWHRIRGGLPAVPVRDLFVHPRDNDLVIGTHGRGAYVLDDIAPLQGLQDASAAKVATLFDLRPAVRYEMWRNDASLGQREWVGKNPEYGALISYWLPAAVRRGGVTIEVKDAAGKIVRTMRDVSSTAGMNRVAWDLRHDAAWQPSRTDSMRARGDSARADSTRPAEDRGQHDRYLPPVRGRVQQAMDSAARADARMFDTSGVRVRSQREDDDEESRFRRPGAPFAVPGQYTVTLRLPDQTLSKTVQVQMDPRIDITPADLQAQLVAGLQARELESRVNRMVFRTNDLLQQLGGLEQQLRQSAAATDGGADGGPAASAAGRAADPRVAMVSAAARTLTQLRDSAMARPIPNLGYRQYPRLREEVGTVARMIAAVHSKPTDAQLRRYEELVQEAQRVDAMLSAILGNDIAKINEMMRANPRIFAERTIM